MVILTLPSGLGLVRFPIGLKMLRLVLLRLVPCLLGFSEATFGIALVGALPLGFQVKLGLVRGKYLPAGLHAAEASYVSSSSISAFRAAIVRAVWS